ncbi:hypothetical protein CRUP_026631 [Coryphaenoides rupestris]|nr:hypothetical protein CRUP_026631 [Coryphaenoides rupestris]
METIRCFRVEQTYAVTTGKWYFEFEVLSGGDMRVGWARPGCRPDMELGLDDQAFGRRMHMGSRYFGRAWTKGDVVGCMINMEDKSMIFTLNGELLITAKGSELCFCDFEAEDDKSEKLQDKSTFKYYTMCGLQEGFEPFAVNMNRNITMWFSKRLPTFVNVPKDHTHIEVTRIDGTVDNPPCLKVTHKTLGTQNSNNDMVYCRLSMPVEFHAATLDESPKLSQPPKEDGSVDYGSITTYHHTVRVFAGQDPASVWVGWVTPDYHYYNKNFSLGKTRTVTVTLGDERGRAVEAGEEDGKEGKTLAKGLLGKTLPEPVKRQMCELLHYFCDCELKHRIEAIVSFSDSFVSKLQYNQKFRYNELMLALNMSAAITAKKTREFRSPPHEQTTWMCYKNVDRTEAQSKAMLDQCLQMW